MEVLKRSGLKRLAKINGQKSVMVFCEETKFSNELIELIHSYISSDDEKNPSWISFAGKFGEDCHDRYDDFDIKTNTFAVTAWNITEEDAVDYFIGSPGKRIIVLEEHECSFQNIVLEDYKEQMEWISNSQKNRP